MTTTATATNATDKELWARCWREGATPFHQDEVNPHLRRFWHELKLDEKAQIFVPLCGKSLDIVWLLEQGHRVLGVELSPVAVRAFFRENRIRPTRKKHGAFTRWHSERLEILCGDFFDLAQADLANVAGVYDRASLTALPEELRLQYAAHLHHLLPPAIRMMLLTTEDPEGDETGASPQVAEEVSRLYAAGFDIALSHVEHVVGEAIPGQTGTLIPLDEKVYLLRGRMGGPQAAPFPGGGPAIN